jgi:hypothetical protein
MKVTGVYKDFPHNSEFREVLLMLPWEWHVSNHEWIKKLAG